VEMPMISLEHVETRKDAKPPILVSNITPPSMSPSP